MIMYERFINRREFSSYEDFAAGLKLTAPDNFNFAYDVTDAWAAEAPRKVAMIWTNDKGECRYFTFSDLKELSDRTAAYFQSLGIGKGDTVMLMLKRRYEFWLSMLALCKIGAVAIPATHLLTAKDIVYRCSRADIKMIVCTGDHPVLDHVTEALPECPTVSRLVSIGPQVPAGFLDFQAGIASAGPFVRPAQPPAPEDVMLIYFTSGTSGNPKMVAHSFTYPLGHIVTGVLWHNLTEDSIHLTIADTGWGKAVWGKLYGQWFAGATVFVYDHEKFTPSDMLEMIGRYHITSLCAPPTIYRFLIKEDFSRYDLSSLRYCCTAGEALNSAVFDRFKELTGLELHEGFGQTETTLTLGTFPWMKPKPGSMGRPNPLYDIRLQAPDGKEPEPGQSGEIVIDLHGGLPYGLFRGYYKDEELTAAAIEGGLYHTGDLAWRDEDGYYWYIGRNDDVIKSSGYRISPFEVESVLMKHPAVMECAVTGVPDADRGYVVKATVILAPAWKDRASQELVAELQKFVKENTAPYKYPRIVEFADELPKTISGKIRRVEIRKEDRQPSSFHKLAGLMSGSLTGRSWSAHNVAWMEDLL